MAALKRGLGRGLSDLLGGVAPTEESGNFDSAYPLDALSPDPDQPRKTFDPEALSQLAESIKSLGVLQPLLARRTEEGAVIVAGERRWRAARMAGLTAVPVWFVRPEAEGKALMSLAENLQRQDLSPLEEAAAMAEVASAFGLKKGDLAARLGISNPQLTAKLKLLELGEPAQRALSEGQISEGHARVLCRLADATLQLRVLNETLRLGWSVRQLEGRVRRLLSGGDDAPPKPKARRVGAAVRLSKTIGVKVSVKTDEAGLNTLTLSGLTRGLLDDLLAVLNNYEGLLRPLDDEGRTVRGIKIITEEKQDWLAEEEEE